MAKTQGELNALKEEVETLNKKLAELTEEELAQVTGGEWTLGDPEPCSDPGVFIGSTCALADTSKYPRCMACELNPDNKFK